MEVLQARQAEAERIATVIKHWLVEKGGDPAQRSGRFRPEDGSDGTYRISESQHGDRSCWTVRLDETTASGRRIATQVFLILGSSRVSALITLDAGSVASVVAPVIADVKCPRLVRSLLKLSGQWYHGNSCIYATCRPVRGYEEGVRLADHIMSKDRAVPVVVVSAVPDAGPNRLAQEIAFQLAGVADTVAVDDLAAWAITEVLGRQFACYWGAARLFWPSFDLNDSQVQHPVWKPFPVDERFGEDVPARRAVIEQVRAVVFRAAAHCVIEPSEITEIPEAAAREVIRELRENARSKHDWEQLADNFANENDRLRDERDSLRSRLEHAEIQCGKLQCEVESLKSHLAAKMLASESVRGTSGTASDTGDEDSAPVRGEVRFYKKIHDNGKYDVLARIQDCGCNNWRSAHSADKAVKGIERLEGRRDFQSLMHCSSCTGGGVWKVRW